MDNQNGKSNVFNLENSIKLKSEFSFESTKVNIDIENTSKNDIYSQLMEIIKSREKQIRDLSVNLGVMNEKLYSTLERNKKLEEENKALNEKIIKKDAILNQEQSNKEIMFIKLENLQNDYEKLMYQVQNGKQPAPEKKKGFFSSFFGKISGKNENEDNNNYYRHTFTSPLIPESSSYSIKNDSLTIQKTEPKNETFQTKSNEKIDNGNSEEKKENINLKESNNEKVTPNTIINPNKK